MTVVVFNEGTRETMAGYGSWCAERDFERCTFLIRTQFYDSGQELCKQELELL